MCGRYTLRTPWQHLADRFGLRVTDNSGRIGFNGSGFRLARSGSIQRQVTGQRRFFEVATSGLSSGASHSALVGGVSSV
jgi:hypothetical protein